MIDIFVRRKLDSVVAQWKTWVASMDECGWSLLELDFFAGVGFGLASNFDFNISRRNWYIVQEDTFLSTLCM